jgi:hypothetical protein
MIIGLKIALTGLVIFVLCVYCSDKDKPVWRSFDYAVAICGLMSVVAIVIGILMAIWL